MIYKNFVAIAITLLILTACGDSSTTTNNTITSDDAGTSVDKPAKKSSSKDASGQIPTQEDVLSQVTIENTTIPSVGTEKLEKTSPNTPNVHPILTLAKKSGCLACHQVDKKVVGPAWNDVAMRYAKDPDARERLIDKVSKGGRGNWTAVVGNMAMPPYAPRVSKVDIEKLVDFILALNE